MQPDPQNNKQRNIIIAIVVLALGMVISMGIYFGSSSLQLRDIKSAISEKINRSDFTITDIVAQDKGWQLVKIAIGSDNNNAFVILDSRSNNLAVVFGPGTSFNGSDLERAGVPSNIISLAPVDKLDDPILKHLPYKTDFYEVDYAGKEVNSTAKNKGVQATLLSVYIYEVPRLGIYANQDSFNKYQPEIIQWIKSIGLNPNAYKLVPANLDDSNGS